MAKDNINQIKNDLSQTKILNCPIVKELQTSFLEYAMSVIVARALPDARDGFKPVHRRVLYAAYMLGLSSDKPHKKSARIVGECMGKYHPHGDSSIYETMVRLAQPFSVRYPLIDGHGNFGSTDDEAAAMRYTEARLSKLGDLILDDIEKDTVKWVDNYDGTEKEPEILTCVIPNLLANGSNGIAVGMATNIPTHNLRELTAAVKLVISNPDVSTAELMEVIPGPDFPTGAEIIGIEGIANYFETGRGSVKIRAKTEIIEREGIHTIVVTEIPYMVAKGALIDKIIELVRDKKIEGISDIQDFSSNEGTRLEIKLKRNIIPEVLLNQLYKNTQLQTSFAVNMLAMVKGEPKVLNLKEALLIYVEHQIECLVNKTIFDKKKAEARKHILEGLHIALDDIDKVISIIRGSTDNDAAVAELMSYFKIDEIQAKAITEMKLRALSGLERQKIEDELKALTLLVEDLADILNNKSRQYTIVVEKLEAVAKKIGDERRSVIRTDISCDINNEDLIPKEDILITMSSKGWIKRLPIDAFKTQKRGGVGVIGAQVHNDDDVKMIVPANTHTDLLFFTDYGKVYRIRGHQIPLGSRIAKGIPAVNIFEIQKDENILSILPVDSYNEGEYLFFATVDGVVKRTSIAEFDRINRGGKIAITLREGDKLLEVIKVEDSTEIYMGASNGKMIRFNCSEVRSMGRTAAGVKGMEIGNKDKIIGLSTSLNGSMIISVGAKGVGKITPVLDNEPAADGEAVSNPEENYNFRKTHRGSKGVAALNTEKAGNLIYIEAVNGDEDLLIITNKGKIIRIKLSTVRETGRNAKGVKLIDLDNDDKIKSVAVFKSSETDTEGSEADAAAETTPEATE